MLRKLDILSEKLSKIAFPTIQAFIAFSIIFHALIHIYLPALAFLSNYIGLYSMIALLVEGIAIILGYITAYKLIRSRFGLLLFIALAYLSGDTLIQAESRPSSFSWAMVFWGSIILIGIFGLLFALIVLLQKTIEELKKKQYLSRLKTELKTAPKSTYLLLIITILSGIVTGIMKSPQMGTPITIEPKDYQIQFRVWAHYEPQWYLDRPYGPAILDQFNRHNVIIQNAIFSIRDAEGNLESFSPSINTEDAQNAIASLNWFQVNYPGIRFQYYAYGLGGQSNGNYEGSIYTPVMLKRFVDVYRTSNLSNVVGVYTDWEGPSRTAPNISNSTLNGWHQALWVDAMAYARNYFPNWTFSCCYPDHVHWDYLDNDPDLQYFTRYNIYMPMWDDYGPMVYRSCDPDKDFSQTKSSSYIYMHAKAMTDGLFKGDPSKVSMWIGCTGCGPYRNDTVVMDHGQPIGLGDNTGFYAFVRDILILKHFKIPSVSIFHAIEIFEPDQQPNGFFYQYGFTDALDRLNETVNGANSTKPFTIWLDGSWNPLKSLALDFQLSFNTLIFLPFAMGFYIVIGITAKRTIKISNNTEKKEEN
jgi:hypothetical protein